MTTGADAAPTGALGRFVQRALDADMTIHSLQVSLGGESLVSCGLAPFGVDVPHRLYSVSKSVTALAVLLLAEEGQLALDDPIVHHYPEMAPVHPWLERTRIDDMLAMVGPHSRTTYDETGGDWLESYFRVTPTHLPGTQFTYDTSASYVLAALVERLSGTPLLDYLRPRLLEPLGIGADARFLRGPDGYSHGGSGLIAAPRDLLVLAETLNAGGAHRGAQVLPQRVVTRLVERRSDPGLLTWGAPLRAGYGRQTWLPGGGAWLMFGLGGQLVYGDPARELAVVVTADTTPVQSGDQRLVESLLHALADDDDLSGEAALAPPTPVDIAGAARPLRGAFQLVTGEGAPSTLRIDVDASGGTIQASGGELSFSTSRPTVAEIDLGDAVVTAGWTAPGTLDVRVSAVGDDIASVRLRIVASGDLVTVMSRGSGPGTGQGWTTLGTYGR